MHLHINSRLRNIYLLMGCKVFSKETLKSKKSFQCKPITFGTRPIWNHGNTFKERGYGFVIYDCEILSFPVQKLTT